MFKAVNFVAALGYTDVASRIRARSHTKVAWPLPIDISRFNAIKINDGNFANVNKAYRFFESESDIDSAEEDQEDGNPDVPFDNPVRALFSIAITGPKAKTKNSVRLLTCVLPRGTVVIGPHGRQVLEEAGEYRVCPPSAQPTPVEDETQLDFVTDDVNLTSFASKERLGRRKETSGHRANIHKSNPSRARISIQSTDTGNGLYEQRETESSSDSRCSANHTVNLEAQSTNKAAATTEKTSPDLKFTDEILAAPDWDNSDSHWAILGNPVDDQVPILSLFADSTATSDLPSPRLPTQVSPAQSSRGRCSEHKSAFELRVKQANQKLLENINGQHTPHPLERRVRITKMERDVDDVESEAMLEEAFAAATPEIGYAEKQNRILDQIYTNQEARYASLNPRHLVKNARATESGEFCLSVWEPLPAGIRPDPNASGPVERAKTSAPTGDYSDLAFLTFHMAPGCAVISPAGYIMNFDTQHRGPIDGKAPPGQGGTYSFFLPHMVGQLPVDFRPWLNNWIGFRIDLPQDTGLVLHGTWLPRWTTPGIHQIAKINGELDLMNKSGRYRVFNDMKPIETSMKKGIPGTDLSGRVQLEAQRILKPYKQYLKHVEEKERADEASQADIEKSVEKQTHGRITKQQQREDLRLVAAKKKAQRRAAQEAKSQESEAIGHGTRPRRPNSRYSNTSPYTNEIEGLLESENKEYIASSSDDDFHPEEDQAERELKIQRQEKKSLIVVLRTTPKEGVQGALAPVSAHKDKPTVSTVSAKYSEEEDKEKTISPPDVSYQSIISASQNADPITKHENEAIRMEEPQSTVSALKRSVSLLSRDEHGEDAPQNPPKRARGRPRKNTSELSRPRLKMGFSNAIETPLEPSLAPTPSSQVKQASVGRGGQANVNGAKQQESTPDLPSRFGDGLLGRSTATIPNPNTASATLKSAAKKLPTKLAQLKIAGSNSPSDSYVPKSPLKTSQPQLDPLPPTPKRSVSLPTRHVVGATQPKGRKPAVKTPQKLVAGVPPKPKYELKSARKKEPFDKSPSRQLSSPSAPSLPAKSASSSLFPPMEVDGEPKLKSAERTKTVLPQQLMTSMYGTQSGPSLALTAAQARGDAYSPVPQTAPVTYQQFAPILPSDPLPHSGYGQQPPHNLSAITLGTSTDLNTAAAQFETAPPLRFTTRREFEAELERARPPTAAPNQDALTTAGDTLPRPHQLFQPTGVEPWQIAPNYPSPVRVVGEEMGYRSLGGRIFSEPAVAIQFDLEAGTINQAGAARALARVQQKPIQ